uniref:Uncharacterized protein n=1 Tax=Oryza brachyantha TaxID=4533 RepID=J3N3G0_ORYBR
MSSSNSNRQIKNQRVHKPPISQLRDRRGSLGQCRKRYCIYIRARSPSPSQNPNLSRLRERKEKSSNLSRLFSLGRARGGGRRGGRCARVLQRHSGLELRRVLDVF